jgi:glycerol-3-phosphate dehydrogenase
MSLSVVCGLAHNYSTEVYHVVGFTTKDRVLARLINGTKVLRAEVQYAVDAEMACNLADVVFRRTGMATGGILAWTLCRNVQS